MPVTTETRFWSCIAASDCVYSLATPRKTRDLGILDRTMGMLSHRLTSWGHHFWSCLMMLSSGGAMCINNIDDGESRRRGAVGPRQRT
jgi:hypothetical protein